MKKILLFVLFAFSVESLGHGDHSAPGALPFPPHGGKVGPAVESEAHQEEGEAPHADHKEGQHDHDEKDEHDEKENDHDHAKEKDKDHKEEKELFFEVVYSKSEISIYPLTLVNETEFKVRDLDQHLTEVKIEIEFPRSKMTRTAIPILSKDKADQKYWKVQIPPMKDIRFFVHLSVRDSQIAKQTKIHIEKK